MILQVKRYPGNSLVFESPDFTVSESFMDVKSISIKLESPTPQTFVSYNGGSYDYADYKGNRYYLFVDPTSKSSNNLSRYTYDLNLLGFEQILKSIPLLDIVKGAGNITYTNGGIVSFFGGASTLAQFVNASLERYFGNKIKWSIVTDFSSTFDHTLYPDQYFSFTNQTCWEAIKSAESILGLTFFIETPTNGNNRIVLTDKSVTLSHTFRQGDGNGLYSIGKSVSEEDKLLTIIRPYGGTRNIPYGYKKSSLPVDNSRYSPFLLLPDVNGSLRYTIESPSAIAKYGIKERAVSDRFQNIYPSIEEVTLREIYGNTLPTVGNDGVSLVGLSPDDKVNRIIGCDFDKASTFFTIYITDIGFNLEKKDADGDYVYYSGIDSLISMRTGLYAGQEFTVQLGKLIQLASDHPLYAKKARYAITLARNEDGTSPNGDPQLVPTEALVAGDSFVILGIYMPDIYLTIAEKRLLSAATEYLNKFSVPQYTIPIDIANSFFIENPNLFNDFKAGNRLKVWGADIDVDIESFIIQSYSLRYTKDNREPKYSVTLSDIKELGLVDKLDAVSKAVSQTSSTPPGSGSMGEIRPSALWYGNKKEKYLHLDDLGKNAIVEGSLYARGNIVAYSVGDGDVKLPIAGYGMLGAVDIVQGSGLIIESGTGKLKLDEDWKGNGQIYHAGTGLVLRDTGGGKLNQFAVSFGTTSGTVMVGNDARVVNGDKAYKATYWGQKINAEGIVTGGMDGVTAINELLHFDNGKFGIATDKTKKWLQFSGNNSINGVSGIESTPSDLYLNYTDDSNVVKVTPSGDVIASRNIVAYGVGSGDIGDELKLIVDGVTIIINSSGLLEAVGGGGINFTVGAGLQLINETLSVKYGTTAGTAAQGNDIRIINGDAANTKLKNGSWWGQKMSDNGSVGGDVLLGAGNVISQIIGVTGGWARGLHWSPVGAINDVGGLSMYGIGTSPSYIRVGFGAFNAATNLFINTNGNIGIGRFAGDNKLSVSSSVSGQVLLHIENTGSEKKYMFLASDKGWIQFGNLDNSASILNISGINASQLSELALQALTTNIVGRGLIGGSLQVNGASTFVGIPRTGVWWYSTGATGWYNETYGGGIYMNDSDQVQVYSNKVFYNSGYRTWGINGHNVGLKLYQSSHIGIHLANNAYTWGIYSHLNGNMNIGRRNGNVNDTSGSDVIILGLDHLNMNGHISASGNVKASGNVVAYAVGSGDISLPIASAAALGAIRVGPTLKITPEGVLDTLASGLAGFNTTGVGNGVGDVTYNSGTKVMTVTKTNFLTTAQGGNYVLKTGDTMSGTLRFNMNGVSSSISSDNSQFLHFRTNAPAGFYFDRSVKVSGELYGGSAYNKLVFHEGNYLTKRQQYTISATKYREITVTGDKDTFYPVAIIFNDVTNSLDYDLYLGKELGSTSNSGWAGNHGNGTSSCAGHWRFRSNGWDGNCNYVQTIRTSFPYAPLLARIEMLGGAFAGVVLWLRGGTANYGLSCDAGFSAINIYYTTANIGNVQYPYNVAPIALANINSYNKGQYSSGDCVISAGINANYLKFPARNLWGQSFDGTGNVTGTWALNGDIMSTTNNTRIDGGAIELYRSIPVIDFHFANAAADFTSRIVESSSGQLNINGTNFVKTAVLPDTPITLGSTTNPWESVVVKNWLYTLGNTGWYNSTYGGGMHMMDNVWVRVYNDKKFYVSNTAVNAIQCGGGFNSGGAGGSGLSVAGSESCSTRIKGQIGSGSNAPVSRYEVQWYNQFARFDVHRGTAADILKWSWKANDTEVGSLSFGGTFYAPVLSAGRIYTGFDGTRTGGISCSNWFASNGYTGWINDTYGGGIYMTDPTFVRIYNNKSFWSNNGIHVSRNGAVPETGNYGAVVATQPANTNNYCHYSLARAGTSTLGLGMNTSNELIIGSCSTSSTIISTWVTVSRTGDLTVGSNITAGSNIKAAGNVVAYAVGSGDISLPIATNIAYGAIKYDNSSILKNGSGQLYLNLTQSAQYNFTHFYMNLPGHYFHNRYEGGTEVYVHYYSSGTTGMVSNANLRFSNGVGGFKTWRITGSGAANWEGTFTSASDLRLKNIHSEITDVLSRLDSIKVYRYAFKDDQTKTAHIGLIAQEVMRVFPEFVTESNTLFLDYQSMGASIAVQGLKQVKFWMSSTDIKIDKLEKEIVMLRKVLVDNGMEIPQTA